MSVQFPDIPAFNGVNRPVRMEIDLFELEYEGDIPAAIEGALYRCGPDPQFPPRVPNDSFINGDGQVSMFLIHDGHVDFRLRYVQTDKFKTERRARKALFGDYRNPYTDHPVVEGVDRTTANTSVMWHGGRLCALKEDGLPHEIDPLSLATRGKIDFDGKLESRTFTAHPKIDPVSGELLFNGYAASGEATCDVVYGSINSAGRLVQQQRFVPPYASMIHDFAVTEDYLVFPIMPATSDLERLKSGGPHWVWDDSLPTYVGIVPRKGNAGDIRYFKGPPRWSFHVLNAFQEGSRIHLDLTVSERIGFPGVPDIRGAPFDPHKAKSLLTRWTFDLARNDDGFSSQILWDKHSDFFEIDPRYVGRPYRHGFMAAKAKDVVFNLAAHILHDREVRTYHVGEGCSIQEPVFVPRSEDAPEGDGYLLAIVNNRREFRAELIVLDTSDIREGPIARIKIPIPLRMTFHSEFVPIRDLRMANRDDRPILT